MHNRRISPVLRMCPGQVNWARCETDDKRPFRWIGYICKWKRQQLITGTGMSTILQETEAMETTDIKRFHIFRNRHTRGIFCNLTKLVEMNGKLNRRSQPNGQFQLVWMRYWFEGQNTRGTNGNRFVIPGEIRPLRKHFLRTYLPRCYPNKIYSVPICYLPRNLE